METTIDSQMVLRYLRYLIEQDMARKANVQAGQRLPIFIELEMYVQAILPNVEAAYDQLATVGRLWAANGIDQILATCNDDDVPLGQGTITAGEWRDLQRVFKALPMMLEMPIVLPTDAEGTQAGPVPIAAISRRPI